MCGSFYHQSSYQKKSLIKNLFLTAASIKNLSYKDSTEGFASKQYVITKTKKCTMW